MDGNRRWAKKRFMPAALGHAAGAQRVRDIVKTCGELGIPQLSLFAFSTENWKRPEEEVTSLMGLFTTYLKKEIRNMNTNGVRLKVLGDTGRFSPTLQALIADAQAQTANNTVITLNICANYGGRWDMLQATKAWQKAHPDTPLDSLTEEALAPYLSTADAPEVDLLIRTGGESRGEQLPALASGLCRTVFLRRTVARLHRRNPETGTGLVCHARPALWLLCPFVKPRPAQLQALAST